MKGIHFKSANRILKRWGFFSDNELVFAAIARQHAGGEIKVRFFESERHAHTAPLPSRIAREQLVRDCARLDLQQVLGMGRPIHFRFERRKLSTNNLTRAIFGPLLRRKPVPDNAGPV